MTSHNILYSILKNKIIPLSLICSYGIFSKRLENEFEIAVVNEPSGFEVLLCMFCKWKQFVKCKLPFLTMQYC